MGSVVFDFLKSCRCKKVMFVKYICEIIETYCPVLFAHFLHEVRPPEVSTFKREKTCSTDHLGTEIVHDRNFLKNFRTEFRH